MIHDRESFDKSENGEKDKGMPKRRWKDLSKTEQGILIALVGGAIVLSPFGGRAVVSLAKYYLKRWWNEGGPYIPPEKDPNKVRDSLYHLKRNEYVEWKYNKSKKRVSLEMTSKGKKLFSEKDGLENLSIKSPDKWDSQWRFIMFDVPEKSRSFRDTFRRYIKDLGFFQFQKSVWIYPYPCEREVLYLAESLGIRRFVIIFSVRIDNDKILRKYFVNQGIMLKRMTKQKSRS
jgi:hypothetical protein